jgi:8-oxo-dGTP pyrophosphatase MutT (NUDIX family)
LIEEEKVALIERHRAGLHYYVFPGGGVDEGETVEQAAVREALEELGVEVAVGQKVLVAQFEQSRQVYFLAERVGGEFGTGTGEEFTDSDPNDPTEGVYTPIWVPIADLPRYEKVFPADLAKLVFESGSRGWPSEPLQLNRGSK